MLECLILRYEVSLILEIFQKDAYMRDRPKSREKELKRNKDFRQQRTLKDFIINIFKDRRQDIESTKKNKVT